jgi:hypothetical protein
MKPRPEDIAEARRVRLLTAAERRLILNGLQAIADDPGIADEARFEAQTRVESLAQLLRMEVRKSRIRSRLSPITAQDGELLLENLWAIANNPHLPSKERVEARTRAEKLTNLLGLSLPEESS